MLENIESLQAILNALDRIELKGRQNHITVIACMNDLERVINSLKKETDNGNLHTEQQPQEA